MKQLLPKLKKINCQKLISKKKSQIDRATLQCFRSRVTFSSVLFNLRLWKREVTDASQYYLKLLKN